MSKALLKPRPVRVVSHAMRERILAGAADAFGRLGYRAVRVEDILEAANVSRPTFYKAYRNQEEVFNELSARHHREIRQRIRAAADSAPDPVAQLTAMIDAFLEWRAGLGPLGRVLDLEARTPGATIAHHRRATLSAMTRLSTRKLQAAGRPATDPVLISALISALESVADSLLLVQPVSRATLERARNNALRLVVGTLTSSDELVPPLPPPPSSGSRRTS